MNRRSRSGDEDDERRNGHPRRLKPRRREKELATTALAATTRAPGLDAGGAGKEDGVTRNLRRLRSVGRQRAQA